MEHQERKLCAVMWQTLGPEIRSGALKEGVKNVLLKKDQEFVLHTDKDTLGDETQVSVRYAQFASVRRRERVRGVVRGGGARVTCVTACVYVFVRLVCDLLYFFSSALVYFMRTFPSLLLPCPFSFSATASVCLSVDALH